MDALYDQTSKNGWIAVTIEGFDEEEIATGVWECVENPDLALPPEIIDLYS